MIHAPGRSAASAMVFLGAGMRIFLGLAVEYSAAYNAGWLCPFLALLLCLPLGIALYAAGKIGNAAPWNTLCSRCPMAVRQVCAVLFALLLIYDCAIVVRHTAATANFVSLNATSTAWLTLPLALVIFIVVVLGPDAEGNSVRIWLKLLPLIFGVVIAVQFERYNINWLTPVLGSGTAPLLQGGLLGGGWLALMYLPWMLAVPDRKRNSIVRPGILSVLAAAALLASLQLLSPTLVETNLSQIARAELILSNNRVSHTLQMFLTILWFGSLLHLIAIEAASAACFIQNSFIHLPKWSIAMICSLLCALLSFSRFTGTTHAARMYRLNFILIGSIFACVMAFALRRSGGDLHV